MQTKLIDQRGVENEYGVPVQTQNKLHDRGAFAARLRIGHKWYYRRSELESWLDAQRVVNTHHGVEAAEAPVEDYESYWTAGQETKARAAVNN